MTAEQAAWIQEFIIALIDAGMPERQAMKYKGERFFAWAKAEYIDQGILPVVAASVELMG